MIKADLFQGDSEGIICLQQDLYNDALTIIFLNAREEYRRAESVLKIDTELGKLLNIRNFDHRALQWFHDSIAGQFRLNYCCKADLFEEPLDPNNQSNDIGLRWLNYLRSELKRLFESHLSLPYWLMTAVAYTNPDPRGLDAEDELYKITVNRYRDLHADIEPIE